MKRLILVIRLCGYASGVAGAAILVVTRRLPLSYVARERWLGAGAGLLVVMFLCFLTGYIFHTLRRMRKR